MKILFLTGAYAIGVEDILQSNCKNVPLSTAANVYQWAVIKGLYDNHADFHVLSFPFLPCFPIRYKKTQTPYSTICYKDKLIGEMVSYSTLMVYKDISIRRLLKKRIGMWLKGNYSSEERIIILTYTPSYTFVDVAYSMKKIYKNLEICSIVTELVDFTGMAASNKSFLKKIQMNRERKATKEAYNRIDKFVLLTQAMEELIPQAKGKSIVVEGIYSPSELLISVQNKIEERTLVYTGSLQEYVGIKELVDAFMLTKDRNYKLVICGSGFCEQYIKIKSEKDKRIEYRGVVSRNEALVLQGSATALINPRKPSEDFTKYSFPSKTMEYLASGTPVIGYKLSGMPEEYKEHLYIPNDLTIQSLSGKIDEVLSLPDSVLKEKASRARSFILEKKTSKHQVGRIIEFLEK